MPNEFSAAGGAIDSTEVEKLSMHEVPCITCKQPIQSAPGEPYAMTWHAGYGYRHSTCPLPPQLQRFDDRIESDKRRYLTGEHVQEPLDA